LALGLADHVLEESQRIAVCSAMPSRSRLPANRLAGRCGISRTRYDHVERRRAALLDRLSHFGQKASAHPSYKSALILLNQRFRTAGIDQRIAILKAASWFISLLEMSSGKPSRRPASL
jgi:hypothetical protein